MIAGFFIGSFLSRHNSGNNSLDNFLNFVQFCTLNDKLYRMIARQLAGKVLDLYRQFPILMITGPRQAGKTTLIKSLFPQLPYFSLEDPDTRARLVADTRGFLANYPEGAVLDEAQRVPDLFSYLQGWVDARPDSHFVLSGSQHFLLMEQVSQSLAGRIGILRLLPLSLGELQAAKQAPASLDELIFKGLYPRVYDRQMNPYDYFNAYLQTYLERDVRQLRQVGDLDLFVRFARLCAGRIGQLLNLSSLATDAGISPNTAQAWLSILQTSHLIFLLQPHHRHFNKRLVKTPKLYFCDTGLACNLLGIEAQKQLTTHFLRGGLFENWVLLELLKHRYNQGRPNNCYFWRDNHGHEVDCLIERAGLLTPVEIKSGATVNMGWFDTLAYWEKLAGPESDGQGAVMYGGEQRIKMTQGRVIGWRDVGKLF